MIGKNIYYVIRRHPWRGFAAVQHDIDDNEYRDVTWNDDMFSTMESAYNWAKMYQPQYGIEIHEECW